MGPQNDTDLLQIPKHSAADNSSALSIHHTLHHPNIVSLFSSFNSPAGEFYVLELCSAGTLQDLLSTRQAPILTEDELRGVVKSIGDALMYLRKELVVHRDIKPSNILLTGDYGVVCPKPLFSKRFNNFAY